MLTHADSFPVHTHTVQYNDHSRTFHCFEGLCGPQVAWQTDPHALCQGPACDLLPHRAGQPSAAYLRRHCQQEHLHLSSMSMPQALVGQGETDVLMGLPSSKHEAAMRGHPETWQRFAFDRLLCALMQVGFHGAALGV